jgi:hypothetical protein
MKEGTKVAIDHAVHGPIVGIIAGPTDRAGYAPVRFQGVNPKAQHVRVSLLSTGTYARSLLDRWLAQYQARLAKSNAWEQEILEASIARVTEGRRWLDTNDR